MQPALRRWVGLAKALGFAPVGDEELVNAVRAIPGPALVLHDDKPVFVNAPARACEAEWRGANVRQFAHVIPVRTQGLRLDLCLWPSQPTQDASRFEALPAYLQPVAELLAKGLADKEIAARMDAPLSTVRTYVQRVLRHLGVRDRRALMMDRR
jgi:DNA-binding NarL/FixJ family response regulator